MVSSCCNLVGDLELTLDNIISVSVNSNTDSSKIGDVVIVGPTIGTISMTGYASNEVYYGCGGKTGVSIQWIRKYDCDNNKVYFIFSGAGRSFIFGDVDGFASLNVEIGKSYEIINANASAGPSSLYMKDSQLDGYGLSYFGKPISFETTDAGCTIPNFGIGEGDLYLQNFNLDMNTGMIPIATYSFLFIIE